MIIMSPWQQKYVLSNQIFHDIQVKLVNIFRFHNIHASFVPKIAFTLNSKTMMTAAHTLATKHALDNQIFMDIHEIVEVPSILTYYDMNFCQ